MGKTRAFIRRWRDLGRKRQIERAKAKRNLRGYERSNPEEYGGGQRVTGWGPYGP